MFKLSAFLSYSYIKGSFVREMHRVDTLMRNLAFLKKTLANNGDIFNNAFYSAIFRREAIHVYSIRCIRSPYFAVKLSFQEWLKKLLSSSSPRCHHSFIVLQYSWKFLSAWYLILVFQIRPYKWSLIQAVCLEARETWLLHVCFHLLWKYYIFSLIVNNFTAEVVFQNACFRDGFLFRYWRMRSTKHMSWEGSLYQHSGSLFLSMRWRIQWWRCFGVCCLIPLSIWRSPTVAEDQKCQSVLAAQVSDHCVWPKSR